VRKPHFGYAGFSAAEIARKYASFSHDELDFPEASSEDLIELCDELAIDHLGRTNWEGNGLLSVVPQSKWTELQWFFFERHPEWFDTRSDIAHDIVRRFYATAVDEVIQFRRPDAMSLLKPHGRVRSLLQNPAVGTRVLRITAGALRRERRRRSRCKEPGHPAN